MARVKIEEELRRCTEELKRCGVEGSPDLKVLESELFGGMKGQKERHVGVMMYPEVRDDGFGRAYDVVGDKPLDVADLCKAHSCLSGGLYKSNPIPDTKIYREVKFVEVGGESYKLVVHSTMNKKREKKVCSICLFDFNGVFLAYVFTTNDPLAFDNFNCFRGEADLSGEPRLECVEQLVFCNNKVQLSRAYLKTLAEGDLEKAMTPTVRSINLWAKVLGDPHMQGLIAVLERGKPTKRNGVYQSDDDKKAAEEIESEQLKILQACCAEYGSLYFRTKYEEYLNETTRYAYNLIPSDFYKKTGQSVILSPEYLKIWDSIAMPCVIGARLRQLKISIHERRLAAAMIPKCVIECSDSDHVWAWKREPGVSMEDLVHSKCEQLVAKVSKVIEYQQDFVNKINFARTSDQVADFLFDTANKEKLGLSERFIQALWTGEISLEGSKADLESVIRRRLEAYGIGFELYNPDLKRSRITSFEVASAIGIGVFSASSQTRAP